MNVRVFVAFSFCALAISPLVGCNENPGGIQAKSSARPSTPAALASTEPPLVTVTPKAAAKVREIVASQEIPGTQFLRVRVVPGGCQGFVHKLDLDPNVSTQDYFCESAGVKVVVFQRQKEMLRGAEVDFGELDGKQGFKIENPNFKGDAAKIWLDVLEKERDVR